MHLRKQVELFMHSLGDIWLAPSETSGVMSFIREPWGNDCQTIEDIYGTPWNSKMRDCFRECTKFAVTKISVKEGRPYWEMVFIGSSTPNLSSQFWFSVCSILDIAGRGDLIQRIHPRSKSKREGIIHDVSEIVF